MDLFVGTSIIVGKQKRKVAGLLYSHQLIRRKVEEIAQEIANCYDSVLTQDQEKDLVLIGILNGAIPFLADLQRELSQLLPAQRVRYDSLAISSYRRGTHPGELRIEKDLKNPISGSYGLIVEDVIDTGYTATYFKQLLIHKGALDVRICALVWKTARQEHEIEPDFSCFQLDKDLFIVGYGLDWGDKCRTLPSVYYLGKAEEIKEA